MSDGFALGLKPPYYAVIFATRRTEGGDDGYGAMAERMAELASAMPGFLGIETARDETGFGITVSYWDSEQAIRDWKRHGEHRIAQERGKTDWYRHYELRVAKVERAYNGP